MCDSQRWKRARFGRGEKITVTDVLLLPGVILPASLAYGALLDALPEGTHAVAKDLELYASHDPRADYTLDMEGDGIRRAAAEAGFERFHLAGYSAGGGRRCASRRYSPSDCSA